MKPVTHAQEKEKLFQTMVIQALNILPLYFQISRRSIIHKCISQGSLRNKSNKRHVDTETCIMRDGLTQLWRLRSPTGCRLQAGNPRKLVPWFQSEPKAPGIQNALSEDRR